MCQTIKKQQSMDSHEYQTKMQRSDDSLLRTVDNFINYCENGSDFSRHRDRLNTILNELNSIEFVQHGQARAVVERTADILKVFPRIPLDEDTIIVKCCHLIVRLMNKNPIYISIDLFRPLLQYLIQFIHKHKYVGVCDALRLMQATIKNHFKREPLQLGPETEELLASTELLLNLIKISNGSEIVRHYDGDSNVEIKNSALLCLETVLWVYEKIPEFANQYEDTLTETLINIIYSMRLDNFSNEEIFCTSMRSALDACRHIACENREWCKEHIGDILGACISHMVFGLPAIEYQPPKKVQPSQQTVIDKQQLTNLQKGGKLVKGRRPRQKSQNKHRKLKSNQTNNKDEPNDDMNDAHSILFVEHFDRFVINTFTTSDSDASDPESGRIGVKKREKETKLRLAALTLLGTVARSVENRVFFGYWHSLFPVEEVTTTNISLLNCILRDPNQRCRIAALQATSTILYGTKAFLIQAETTENPPTNFMPFSISLGNQIRMLYISLTQAMHNENSLPVLTQILKCLAILVQSTTFLKLQKPRGLISKFVSLIRRLMHHKDSTIKVGSFIVMEFLLARSEIIEEITDCVGLSRSEVKCGGAGVHDFGENDVINAEENQIDSEYEEDDEELLCEQLNAVQVNDQNPKISWLLQIALETLGVTVNPYTKPRQPATFFQLRHQGLQIILVMAAHFTWIKLHLNLIAEALKNTLEDDVATVRHQAARCLDVIANGISTHLVKQSNQSDFECDIDVALEFWSKMFPIITQQLYDLEQRRQTRWTFCDAYSNIGVHVYERLARTVQIRIISQLSSIAADSSSHEPEVKASAVRALAIFVMFPSLKEDICYIRDTIEAILKILYNEIIFVRIKASWALANITDVLVLNASNVSVDQLPDYLFLELFEKTANTFTDNEKVRMNAVRIYGNLLRLITTKQISKHKWQTICYDAIKKLCEQAKIIAIGSNVKVKWNACYAIGNFMKNSIIFELGGNQICWQELVFETLSEIIVNCANFKVRINGANALAVPAKRENYGKFYLNVWSALSLAIYQANQLTDFNEYNHRDNLLDQLCITISHLIKLATNDDLIELENILLQHLDSNKQNWIRVINRMVPEKAASLLEANLYLRSLCTDSNLTNEQKTAAMVLESCFGSITEYDN